MILPDGSDVLRNDVAYGNCSPRAERERKKAHLQASVPFAICLPCGRRDMLRCAQQEWNEGTMPPVGGFRSCSLFPVLCSLFPARETQFRDTRVGGYGQKASLSCLPPGGRWRAKRDGRRKRAVEIFFLTEWGLVAKRCEPRPHKTAFLFGLPDGSFSHLR